jgi:hypothetical protein
MNKNAIIGVVAAVVIIGLVVITRPSAKDPSPNGEEGGNTAASQNKGDENGGKKAPVVTRESGKAEIPTDKANDLKLPGALPALKGVAANENLLPTKAHEDLKVDGDLQEVDARLAIQTVFPKVRTCYVDLRKRAPQAGGRMLMRFRVKGSTASQAGTGELYLKETQFTDPKFLSCLRKVIDTTKFQLDKPTMNGTVTFTMHLSPEDLERAAKAEASRG